ncbi:hypothetical protein ACT1U9_11315 [Streptomyces sp. BR1]|uniref:hypothetical protein n=1 Tax=Streptomyces sp. BR1 TaxID=1592323 RepID=UPI00402B9141
MRNVLRAALATAVVAGVALTPVVAATTALAAPSVPVVSKAAPSNNDRYSGTPVYIGKGYVAVLRNHTSDGGPEAWIRAVGPDWKPGDNYMLHVMEVLDRNKTSAVVDGIDLSLNRVGGDLPELVVSGKSSTDTTVSFPERVHDGATAGQDLGARALADGSSAELWKKDDGSYVLELGTRDGKPRGSVTAWPGIEDGKQVGGMWVGLNGSGKIGSWLNPATGGFDGDFDVTKGCTTFRTSGTPFEGLNLKLSNGPEGPIAEVGDVHGGPVYDRLSAAHPTGVLGGARVMLDLAGGPVFQMHVASAPGKKMWATIPFPAKPSGKGCAADTTGKSGSKAGTPSAKTATATSDITPQTASTGPQIVPQGAVAAGAEVKGSGHGNTALVAGGAGLASAGVAGLGFAALRRRSARR